MDDLFGAIFGTDAMVTATGDRAWLAAMCRTEAALARACASAGLIEPVAADLIAIGCAELAELGPAGLAAAAVPDGNPVIALVNRIRTVVSALPSPLAASAASAVHLGATSQDILDTAAMLVSADALDLIIAELGRTADACAELAAAHRDTPMAGRTLLQQAAPTTFGSVAINWTVGLDSAIERLTSFRERRVAVQLGGAAGTLAALYPHGAEVRALLAGRLELADPHRCWHAERSRITELASVLGGAAAAIGKVATDVVLLAQTEVAEVAEATGGRSSSMPHKQNPIAAISARAATGQAPGLVATLLNAASGQEHQRAAGGWHAEWPALNSLLAVTGGAAHRLASSVTGLVVNTERMHHNLDASQGELLAERVSVAITPRLGNARAGQLLRAAADDPRGFRAALESLDETGLSAAELDALLNPLSYLGHAREDVDNYLRGRRQ